MSESVLTRLAEFGPEDKTPRLVSAIFSAVPGAPELPHYLGLANAVAALGGTPADMPKATNHLHDPDLADVLWMSGLVDTGDKSYAVVTGLSSALSMFFGKTATQALETDVQQRNDAVLKAFALAYLAWKATPGTVPERAENFAKLPAGRALLTYYAAVEIALPFADNAMIGGANAVSGLMDKYGAEQLKRFSGMLGGKSADGVQGALASLLGPIDQAVTTVRPHAQRIANQARTHLPTAMNVADKAAGVLANVADVMPVYRYLGSRLAAEGAAFRARS